MEKAQEAVKFDVGGVLREARERMGMSVEDVAGRLKFAARQITALEEGNYDQLPEMAFVRGFVRSYAKLVQLDAAPLLDALPGAPAQVVYPEKKPKEDFLPSAYAARKHNILWLAGALAVALVLGVLAWEYDSVQTPPKPAIEAKIVEEAKPVAQAVNIPAEVAASAVADAVPVPVNSIAPNAETVAAKVAAQKAAAKAARKRAAQTLLQIDFDEDSWVEVKDGEGKVLLSQIGVRGSEQSINGTPPFAVVIGNISGVRVFYKGAPVDLAPYTDVDVARLKLE